MSLFKNAIVYRIGADWTAPALEDLEQVLLQTQFVSCGPTDEESAGWVPPRGKDHSPLGEHIAGQLILKLAVERKSVPASAVNKELDVRCKLIEATRGTKPGRKEKKEIKEDILHEFMPRAFSKLSSHVVWVDAANRFIVVGTGSRKAADNVVNHLVDAMAGAGHILPISQLATALSPASAMAHWLTTQEAPSGFSVDRELELKQPDNEKSVVRYARHNLEIAEIVQHIAAGKLPTQLALTWDSRVSIVLTDDLSIRKIEMLEVTIADSAEDDGFDGDVAIVTGEFIKLLPDLILALGGEMAEVAEPSAAAPGDTPTE